MYKLDTVCCQYSEHWNNYDMFRNTQLPEGIFDNSYISVSAADSSQEQDNNIISETQTLNVKDKPRKRSSI